MSDDEKPVETRSRHRVNGRTVDGVFGTIAAPGYPPDDPRHRVRTGEEVVLEWLDHIEANARETAREEAGRRGLEFGSTLDGVRTELPGGGYRDETAGELSDPDTPFRLAYRAEKACRSVRHALEGLDADAPDRGLVFHALMHAMEAAKLDQRHLFAKHYEHDTVRGRRHRLKSAGKPEELREAAVRRYYELRPRGIPSGEQHTTDVAAREQVARELPGVTPESLYRWVRTAK